MTVQVVQGTGTYGGGGDLCGYFVAVCRFVLLKFMFMNDLFANHFLSDRAEPTRGAAKMLAALRHR